MLFKRLSLLILFCTTFGFGAEPALSPIDPIQSELNALLCSYLREHGINTATTQDNLSLETGERLAPVRVAVSGAMVGAPAQRYQGIGTTEGRFGRKLLLGTRVKPYVRFDWRNAAPLDNECMPDALANNFIDVENAKDSALNAYKLLKNFFGRHGMELQDISFLMNEAGDTICSQISTYNACIAYLGTDEKLAQAFSSSRNERAAATLNLLKKAAIPRERLIISGPSSVAKTTLIREMEKMLGLSTVTRDANPEILLNNSTWAIEVPANEREKYQSAIPLSVSVYVPDPKEPASKNSADEVSEEEFDYRLPTNLEIAEEIELLRNIMRGSY